MTIFERAIVALLLAGSLACSRTYLAKEPPSFKRFHKSNDYRLITADDILLKVREEENYPKASFRYWVDALRDHLEKQGYLVKSEDCFKTPKGLDGCTVDFLAPLGAQDWVLSESLFVKDDTIYPVEAAGPVKRFAQIDKELKAAVRTFRTDM